MKTIFTLIGCLILSLLCMNLATAQSKKPAKGPDEESYRASPASINETYQTHTPVFIPSNLPGDPSDEKIQINASGIVSVAAAGGASSSNCAPSFTCIGYFYPSNSPDSVMVSIIVTACTSSNAGKHVSLQELYSNSNTGTRVNSNPLCSETKKRNYFLFAKELKACSITMPNGKQRTGSIIVIYYKRDNH